MNAIHEHLRHQQAVLATIAEALVGTLPPPVLSALTAAADELLDPTTLPELLPLTHLAAQDPRQALGEAVTFLREAIPVVDAATALACGRAIRFLLDAEAMWPE